LNSCGKKSATLDRKGRKPGVSTRELFARAADGEKATPMILNLQQLPQIFFASL